jgi:transposase
MGVAEMKKEIKDKINNLDESQLKMVEEFIEKINLPKGREWDLKKYVNEILDERGEVLQKLAQ